MCTNHYEQCSVSTDNADNTEVLGLSFIITCCFRLVEMGRDFDAMYACTNINNIGITSALYEC